MTTTLAFARDSAGQPFACEDARALAAWIRKRDALLASIAGAPSPEASPMPRAVRRFLRDPVLHLLTIAGLLIVVCSHLPGAD